MRYASTDPACRVPRKVRFLAAAMLISCFQGSTFAQEVLPDPLASAAPGVENISSSTSASSGVREFGPPASRAEAASAPAAEVQQVEMFAVTTGQDLRGVMETWAARSGWDVSWEINRRLILGAGAQFQGPFEDAIDGLVTSLGNQLSGTHVSLCAANHVVRVSSKRGCQ